MREYHPFSGEARLPIARNAVDIVGRSRHHFSSRYLSFEWLAQTLAGSNARWLKRSLAQTLAGSNARVVVGMLFKSQFTFLNRTWSSGVIENLSQPYTMKALLLQLLLAILVYHEAASQNNCVLRNSDYVEFRYRGGDYVLPSGTKTKCIIRDISVRGSYCSNRGVRCTSRTYAQTAIDPNSLQHMATADEWLVQHVACVAIEYTRITGTLIFNGYQGSGCRQSLGKGLSIDYEVHIPKTCRCRHLRRIYY